MNPLDRFVWTDEDVVIDESKEKRSKYKIVQATYYNRPAEHCETCVERNGKVVTLEVEESVPVPNTIG